MRKTGATTSKICWNLKVLNNDTILFEKEYPSLKMIGDDIGFKYNRVVELATGRKKQQTGTYDSVYVFTKLNKTFSCMPEDALPDEVEEKEEVPPKEEE